MRWNDEMLNVWRSEDLRLWREGNRSVCLKSVETCGFLSEGRDEHVCKFAKIRCSGECRCNGFWPIYSREKRAVYIFFLEDRQNSSSIHQPSCKWSSSYYYSCMQFWKFWKILGKRWRIISSIQSRRLHTSLYFIYLVHVEQYSSGKWSTYYSCMHFWKYFGKVMKNNK